MIRITAGEWKGRGLVTPSGQKTRPTQAKLRQALFNSIQFEIEGARVLDLFAGSGALGLEALSRGAEQAVFVEQDRAALDALTKNIRTLGAEKISKCVRGNVKSVLPQLATLGPFRMVFADPPYAEGFEMELLENWPWTQILEPEGLFLLEWGVQKSKIEALPEETEHLVKIREKVYGDSVLSTFRRK